MDPTRGKGFFLLGFVPDLEQVREVVSEVPPGLWEVYICLTSSRRERPATKDKPLDLGYRPNVEGIKTKGSPCIRLVSTSHLDLPPLFLLEG